MKRFLVLGHSIMDTRVYLESFPKEDGMIILQRPIVNSCGGSAANVSYNLSKLGFEAHTCSTVGNDRAGEFIINSLKEAGVKPNIRVVKGNSGRAVVLINKKGDVMILESLGVSDRFFKYDEKEFENVDHLHITGTNYKLILSYSKKAKKEGITISADLGRSKVGLGAEKLKPLLRRLNVLLLNRKELCYLTTGEFKDLDLEKTKELAKELYDEFGFIVVVKGGAKEALAYDGKFYIRKPIKVKVVDTIGAGDAFDAAFIGLWKLNNDTLKSLKFGLKIASLKVQRLGAQALPSKKFLKKLIKSFI